MPDTNNNGQNPENEKPQDADQKAGDAQAQKPAAPAAQYGFDAEGCFFVRAPVTTNPYAVIGFLEDAKLWYRSHVKRMENELQKKKLIQPNTKWPFNFKNWRR